MSGACTEYEHAREQHQGPTYSPVVRLFMVLEAYAIRGMAGQIGWSHQDL